MMFELQGEGGVYFLCSSPSTARKLMEKGGRLLDKEQAEYLRLVLETVAADEALLAVGPPRPTQH